MAVCAGIGPGRPTKNPSRARRTGFVCPARHPRAEADLALAAFIRRPQAEAQIGALAILHAYYRRVTSVQTRSVVGNDLLHAGGLRRYSLHDYMNVDFDNAMYPVDL
jgi:hypothetical protein